MIDRAMRDTNDKPGMAELPMTVRLCKASKALSSSGMADGTAGKVSDLQNNSAPESGYDIHFDPQ